MDFPTLPRRDLQALCKRNGIRANMTNAAMTDALRALPTIDGIEEYVKHPVAVPEPAAKEEEPKLEKQASPLPRARRVTAKASKPSKPSDAGEENTPREPNKEDAAALGVGRRGASRRARTDAVVLKPAGKASTEEEKQGSPLATASRVEGGEAEEDLKREANKENAPAPVVGRRGPSRRARPASAIESAGAEAGEEQRQKEGSQVPRSRRVSVKSSEPSRLDGCDRETEKEGLNREASTDAAPIHGVGRRGPSRRTRPAPAVVAAAVKVVTEEEQTAPIPRGRHVKGKSTEPIKPNDCEEDEKDGTKLNEEEADVPSLGVGRRGVSRFARRAPAVASIPRGHGVKVKSPEIINLDDSDEEENEDTKPEKDEGAPAIGVGGRCASRRAPAPVEAPATRRMVAASKTEAGDVVAEPVPFRSTRQRKPTMKAAAAAEDKAPPKGTRRGMVKNIISQHKELEKPQDAVSDAEVVLTPVSNVDCNNQEDSEEVVLAPQDVISDGDIGCDNIEDSADAPKQEDKEISDVVTIDGKMLMVQSPAEEPRVTDQECMDEPTLQEQQVNFEKYPAHLDIQEDSPILGIVSIATGDAAGVEKGDNLTDIEGSSEELLNKRVCKELHGADIEMEMLPLTAEGYTAEVVTGDAVNENEVGDLNEVLHIRDEIGEVDTEDDGVCQEKESMDCDELLTELVDDAVFPDCSGNISLVDEEKATEENTEDGLGCQEKGDVVADMVVPDMADEVIHLDCSDKNTKVVEEAVKVEEITSETAFCPDACDAGKQNEVSSLENIWEVTVEDGDVSQKSAMTTKDMPQSASVVDEDDEEAHYKTEIHTDQQKKVVNAENEPDADDGIFQENDVLATAAEDINTDLVYASKQKELVADDNVPEQAWTDHNVSEVKMTGSEVVEEEAALIIDELQQSTITMNEELTGTYGEVVEEDNAVVVTEEVPYSTCTVDEDIKEDQLQTVFVHADQVVTADNAPELKMTDCEVVEKGVLIIDEKQQSKVEMDEDVVDDHLKTDVVSALEQKKVVSTDEVPNLTRTDGEVVITEEVPQSTGAMDECVQENHFEITDSVFTQDGEQNNAATTDSVQEVTGADWDAENTFTGDFPQELNVAEESNEQITPALLGNATESMSKSIITVEPPLYLAEDTSVCKNSSEKNITESLVMKEEKRSKVAKKSEDLTKLSLNQLKAKLKEKLKAKENKEGKRVALARVDGNVCRSHTKEQQPNLNLQQH